MVPAPPSCARPSRSVTRAERPSERLRVQWLRSRSGTRVGVLPPLSRVPPSCGAVFPSGRCAGATGRPASLTTGRQHLWGDGMLSERTRALRGNASCWGASVSRRAGHRRPGCELASRVTGQAGAGDPAVHRGGRRPEARIGGGGVLPAPRAPRSQEEPEGTGSCSRTSGFRPGSRAGAAPGRRGCCCGPGSTAMPDAGCCCKWWLSLCLRCYAVSTVTSPC